MSKSLKIYFNPIEKRHGAFGRQIWPECEPGRDISRMHQAKAFVLRTRSKPLKKFNRSILETLRTFANKKESCATCLWRLPEPGAKNFQRLCTQSWTFY